MRVKKLTKRIYCFNLKEWFYEEFESWLLKQKKNIIMFINLQFLQVNFVNVSELESISNLEVLPQALPNNILPFPTVVYSVQIKIFLVSCLTKSTR
jgi:hypothetical protein